MSQVTTNSAEPRERRPVVAPPVDIFEDEEKLLVVADMPGLSAGDVHIHFDKGTLTLEGRRTSGVPDGKLLATETRLADYRRAFTLPRGIDSERITAVLEHGVLSVHLPKLAALRPRAIPVRAS